MHGELKTNAVNLEMLSSWLRQVQEKTNEILRTIEHTKDYRDVYVKETVRSIEMNFKQIRHFIESN